LPKILQYQENSFDIRDTVCEFLVGRPVIEIVIASFVEINGPRNIIVSGQDHP